MRAAWEHGRKDVLLLLSGSLLGVAGAGAASVWWQDYTRPRLWIATSVVRQVEGNAMRNDSTFSWGAYYDDYRACTMASWLSGAPSHMTDTIDTHGHVDIRFLVRNTGRTAANNLRIGIKIDSLGPTEVLATPNVALGERERRTSVSQDVQVVNVKALPPRTSAIVTYRTHLPPLMARADTFKFAFSIPFATADELGYVTVKDERLSGYEVDTLESRFYGEGGSLRFNMSHYAKGGNTYLINVRELEGGHGFLSTTCGMRAALEAGTATVRGANP